MAKDLRIRNVPDTLHRQLVAIAASRGSSVEEYLLQALQQLTESERPGRRSPRRRSSVSQRSAFYEQAAAECLATLTAPEANVVKLRLGIGDAEPHSLQSIADSLGVSRQRVHQIEASALRKLKHPARLDVLSFAMRKLQLLDRQSRW